MIIQTTRFGAVEIADKQCIHFNKGIPGFEQNKDYVQIDSGDGLFAYLQSLTDPDLTFITSEPFNFFPEYEFQLSESAQEELAIDSEEQVAILNIVTIRSSTGELSMNLLAPIVLNKDTREAKQIILHDSHYRTNHLISQAQTIEEKAVE